MPRRGCPRRTSLLLERPCGPCRVRRNRSNETGAAAGDDALGDRGTGRVQGILDASLLLLELRFAARADVDLSHAAGQLGETLLELLAVVVAVGAVDFRSNLVASALDVASWSRRLRPSRCCRR